MDISNINNIGQLVDIVDEKRKARTIVAELIEELQETDGLTAEQEGLMIVYRNLRSAIENALSTVEIKRLKVTVATLHLYMYI